MMIATTLDARIQKRKAQGLLRTLQSPAGLIDLTSNDYFGFGKRSHAAEKDREQCPGATGSRLLTGNTPYYEQLEEQIARFHRAESCLIYNSGYTANLGLISALGTKDTTFLFDLEIHASMIDGMRLSDAKSLPFRHNDLESLEGRLKKAAAPVFVLVESVYSISGDLAPLRAIASLCTQYGAGLIIDEAHATGVYGPKGEGLVVQLGLELLSFARVHTFSKALGAHGACVAGSRQLKEYLINFSRALIYTTALPPIALAQIESSYEMLKKESGVHQMRLNDLIAYFCRKASICGTQSPIQPLFISGIEKIRALAKKLQTRGFDVRAMVPPTTARRKECLRIVLHSFNQKNEIDRFIEALS